MKKTTIDRINANSCGGRNTYIGRYAYRTKYDITRQVWDIAKCRRDNLGRHWIDKYGNICDGWTWCNVTI